jgi:pimeloyl-ACP methyl ester carboxylesterase
MHPTAPTLRRAYVDGPFGQIHLYDSQPDAAADAGTPLLMLHQSPTSSLDWAATFPFFIAAGQRVVAMDTPGYGMSDAPQVETRLDDYVPAVLAVLDALKLPRVDLIGHHTGVQIGAAFAAAHPDRARRLVLYGVPLLSADARRALWKRIVPPLIEGDIHRPRSGGEHLSAQFKRQEYFGGPPMAQRLLLTALMAGPNAWFGNNAALNHDIAPVLKRVRSPILFLSSAGEMLHAATKAAAGSLRPGDRFVTLETEGHMAQDTDPAAFVAATLDFLRSTVSA